MNKIITYGLLILGLLTAVSCKKAFEDHPLNFTTEEYIWDYTDPSGSYAQFWVAKIYNQLPGGFNRINGVYLDCASDDAVPSNKTNPTWNVVNGGYSPLATYDDNWSISYDAIRRSNIFLANYKTVHWADPSIPRYLSSEVRVMRAFFYYEMMKRYGGIPLLGDKVYTATDPSLFTIKRNSFNDCVNYVVNEITAVQDSLRADAPLSSRGSGNGTSEGTDNDEGRIRKSIALAIKAKVLLLAASPLFNASTNPGLDYTGYSTYDRQRWKAAADAAKAVMDLNLFVLEPNRYLLNTTRVNKEFIFVKNGGGFNNGYGPVMTPVGYFINNSASQGLVSPTQELVDAFPMSNGKAIADAASGYDANDPYANRDPRLGQTVFYNGQTWMNRAVETFENGKDKPNNNTNNGVQTLTGYYAKKYLPNDATSNSYSNGVATNAFCIIRYADILLMYAEAQNEFSGPDPTVYSAVEAVRQRAGLSPYALTPGLSQLQMRDVIRNERRVEFAFEEQRFYDIRRWKIAKAVYNTTLHGIKITKGSNGALSYSPVSVVSPFFNDNMYLLPIVSNEVLVNPNIKQNPNY